MLTTTAVILLQGKESRRIAVQQLSAVEAEAQEH